MSNTVINKFTAIGAYGSYATAGSATVTQTAGAVSPNTNSFACSGNDLLVAVNTDAGDHHVKISAAYDPWRRTRDIGDAAATYVVKAGKLAIFGPFKTDGWATGGQVFFTADSATIKWFIVQMNPQ